MAGSYEDRDGKIWMDGGPVDWRDAGVHLLTHVPHYASSVFEGERCCNGKICRSRDHSARLLRQGWSAWRSPIRPIRSRHILPEEIAGLERCWLTDSAAEIAPAGQIGDQMFRIDEMTRRVAAEYDRPVRVQTAAPATCQAVMPRSMRR